jgi:hypothetical protein
LPHNSPDKSPETSIANAQAAPDLVPSLPVPQAHIPSLNNIPASRTSHPLQNSNINIFSGTGTPIIFSLTDLCSFIDSNVELQKALILESTGYHKWRLVLHRFVVLKLHFPESSSPRRRLWLRFDRRPVRGLGFVLGVGVTMANDQVS